MRAVLTLATLLSLAAPARATDDPRALVGLWDIRVLGGTAGGDFGTVRIRLEDGALRGAMTFVDTSAAIEATEDCVVQAMDRAVSITCTVLTPDPSGYAPDDFTLRLVTPDRMEGEMLSTTGGPAVLTRRGTVPTS